MAVPFISTTDLGNYLGHAIEPDKGAIAVDSACDMCRRLADQFLYYIEDDVVELDSEGTDVLLLPEMPVYEVSSVIGPGEIALVVGTDYEFDKESGAITTVRRDYKFLKGRKIYTAIYTHGYTDDATGKHADVELWPSALRMLALHLASRIYTQQLVKAETIGGYSATYSTDESIVLTDRERSLLEKVVGVGRRR